MPNKKRSFYRIRYPQSHCPFFRFQGHNYTVLDLSETGLKFELFSSKGLTPDEEIQGVLLFRDGASLLLHGSIKRTTHNTVSIALNTPIPLSRIMEEQRVLIQSPTLKVKSRH